MTKAKAQPIEAAPYPSLETVGAFVCLEMGISLEALRGLPLTSRRKQSRGVVLGRRLFSHAARELTVHSFTEIGAYIGTMDHTTARHHVQTLDPELEKPLKRIVARCRESGNTERRLLDACLAVGLVPNQIDALGRGLLKLVHPIDWGRALGAIEVTP